MDVIELKQALRALNVPVDTAEADQVLSAFGVDSSKRLELHEFRTLVERLRAFQQGGQAKLARPAIDSQTCERVSGEVSHSSPLSHESAHSRAGSLLCSASDHASKSI